MGLSTGDIRFLLSAKAMGMPTGSACTLGHQVLFFTEKALNQILAEYTYPPVSLPSDKPIHFAEDVLRPLGFAKVNALDNSAYDGADLIHDMNLPMPREMHERYDLVIDGGTLEHVFDVKTALENVMRMTKIGGSILLNSPANNNCGHGFYQFSPELFFRIFVPENGFELLRVYMVCDDRYFHVADPITVHGRVELLNSKHTLLFVHARKTGPVPDRIQVPQQSDYVAKWTAATAPAPQKQQDGRLKALVRSRISPETKVRISRAIITAKRVRNSFRWKGKSKLSNRKFYVPVTDWNVTTARAINERSGS